MLETKTFTKDRISYNVFEYLIALSFLLDGRFIWLVGKQDTSMRSNLLWLMLIVSVIVCIYLYRYVRKDDLSNCIWTVLILSSYLLFYLILQSNNRTMFIKLFISVLVLVVFYYLCCLDKNIPSVLEKYENLVIIIAIISLIIWFMGSIMGIIKPSSSVLSYWTGKPILTKSYYGLYYETQTTINRIFGSQIIRNSAIFTEAPMANMHFCIALLIEMFLKDNVSKKKSIILITAIASTFSVVGYSLVLGTIILKKMISNHKSRLLNFIKYCIMPIAIIFMSIIIYRLISSKLSTYSGSYRIDDYIVCYKAWKKNILLGAGIGNDEYIKLFMGAWRAVNTGLSNSVLQILAHGGLYIGILYFLIFFLGFKDSIESKNKEKLVFIIFLLALLSVVIFSYQYITIFMIIHIYVTSARKQKSNINEDKNVLRVGEKLYEEI